MQQPQKFIPEQNELSAIERDLRFFPVENDHPHTLTPTQIEFYNTNGYLMPFRVFDDAEIAAQRDYLDQLLAKVLAVGGSSYSIATAHRNFGPVYDLITHPKIVRLVTDLLGPDVIGWGAHYFCKMPHDGKTVQWHQDAIYWPLTPTRTVTVWLAIDDADTENACMQFLPGSHLSGPLTHLPSEAAEHNVLDQKVPDVEQFGAPVPVVLKAGELSLHNDLLLHGSDANDSERRRCGLTLRYCAAEVRAHLGWNDKGVVVHGSDPSGHWANFARPEQLFP